MLRNGCLLIALILVGCSVVGVGLANTFGEAALGYSIDYPADWVADRPSEFTARFTGAAETPAANVTFTIQNAAATSIGGPYASVEELLDNLKCQLVTGAEDICLYMGSQISLVDLAGQQLVGPQVIAEYVYDGALYKDWVAIVPHGSGDIFYVLSFTALQDDYDQFEPVVLEMLTTWAIVGADG